LVYDDVDIGEFYDKLQALFDDHKPSYCRRVFTIMEVDSFVHDVREFV
jgi:hypothetical protein